jgi:hypothetical protein
MKVNHEHAAYIKGESLVSTATYSNGRLAIRLIDPEDGSPQVTASVNLPDEPCPDGCTYMKTYSENEGILEDLIAAGIVTPPMAYSVELGAPLVRFINQDATPNN